MNYLLSFITFFTLGFAFSQNEGVLVVEGFKNTTLNLDDNVQLDTLSIKITNQNTGESTTISFTKDMEERPQLKAAEYELICSVKGEKDWTVKDVKVSADMITFITLLYEPEQKLTWRQKRKRKKQYFMFER